MTAVIGTAYTDETSIVNNVDVVLPDGIETGMLLIVFVRGYSTQTTTWPTDWTEEGDKINIGAVRSIIGWKVVDGTEGFTGSGDSINVSFSGTYERFAIAYLIDGHGSDVELTFSSDQDSGATVLDPPSHSPSWGASNETLWLAHACASISPQEVPALPSGYVNWVTPDDSGTLGVYGCAQKISTAASENPGNFTTVDVGFYGFTATVAVKGYGGELQRFAPTADVATTGWSSTPLYSKVDDDPDSPDATVISATLS